MQRVRRHYPADDQLPGAVLRMTRAVGVAALARGDLVMMRKELLTLKRFAERDASR